MRKISRRNFVSSLAGLGAVLPLIGEKKERGVSGTVR